MIDRPPRDRIEHLPPGWGWTPFLRAIGDEPIVPYLPRWNSPDGSVSAFQRHLAVIVRESDGAVLPAVLEHVMPGAFTLDDRRKMAAIVNERKGRLFDATTVDKSLQLTVSGVARAGFAKLLSKQRIHSPLAQTAVEEILAAAQEPRPTWSIRNLLSPHRRDKPRGDSPRR